MPRIPLLETCCCTAHCTAACDTGIIVSSRVCVLPAVRLAPGLGVRVRHSEEAAPSGGITHPAGEADDKRCASDRGDCDANGHVDVGDRAPEREDGEDALCVEVEATGRGGRDGGEEHNDEDEAHRMARPGEALRSACGRGGVACITRPADEAQHRPGSADRGGCGSGDDGHGDSDGDEGVLAVEVR